MRYFSKSQFTRGLQCAKSLWLYRQHPELRDEMAPDQRATFEQGTAVGVLAREWIKGGVLVAADHTDPRRALDETAAALAADARVLYEAAFLHDDVLIRADIVAKNPEGDWDLYEVKSATETSDLFLRDVAVQRYVMAGAGLRPRVAHVVHLDPAYVRRGALDLVKLFRAEDVTRATDPLLDLVPEQLQRLKLEAARAEAPDVEIGPQCTKSTKGYDCDFQGFCWKNVPEYSVFDLAGARKDKTTKLWRAGARTVLDVPADEKLNDYQKAQLAAARAGEAVVDVGALRAFLATLVYPLHHLDFEAINPALPPYDGCRPYQTVPFEASVHVQEARGGPVAHFEFLGDGLRDPRPALDGFLTGHIGDVGSVLAYHKSYEGTILKHLAAESPNPGLLLGFEARLLDLADPFKKAWYHHPGQYGSWSIKKVLPVVVPDLSYADLAIKDGMAAMLAYARLMTDKTLTPAERAQIAADLKAYCGRDTFAMVRILDRLYELAGAVAA